VAALSVAVAPGRCPCAATPVVGPIVIISRDKVIRDSLAVLLNVKGYGRSKAYGFDSWHSFLLEPLQQLIVLDVSEFSRGAFAWFVESFNTTIGRQRIIALVWPHDAPNFNGKVDEVITKSLVLKELLRATDKINSEAVALSALRMNTHPRQPIADAS
jgi:hypothetical protein